MSTDGTRVRDADDRAAHADDRAGHADDRAAHADGRAAQSPGVRLRRLRSSEAMRDLVARVRPSARDLILPVFVTDRDGDPEPIAALPGHHRWPASQVGAFAKQVAAAGIPGVLVFGVPARTDAIASRALDDDGPAQRGIAAIKAAAPDLVVFADTCVCSYTDHGHCGIVRDGVVDNDASVELIARAALSQARAGADLVAPSDMMDGRVRAIRRALDDDGLDTVGICSYAAKFASAFYGPFREAAHSAPSFGDRRGYQLDPRDPAQAIRSIERDVAEGADLVMVKPALPYLDVIASARRAVDVPLVAYQVSGEAAMLGAAAAAGSLDERAATLEAITAIRRAGADIVITYHALALAEWLDGR